jgi:hypothetical protein
VAESRPPIGQTGDHTGEVTDAFQRSLADPCECEMNTTDATLTNGRYELPAHARGVLVLADPPEAGWRFESPPSEEVAAEVEQARGATHRSSVEGS